MDHRTRVRMIEAWARHDAEAYLRFVQTLKRHGFDPRRLTALDLGCGATAPVALLLHAAGAAVTGVDAYTGYRWGLGFRPGRYLSYFRQSGLIRTARKAVGELVYDRKYYSTLGRAAALSLSEKGLDLRQMRIEALEFPDAGFDAVHSNATWEHLTDVRAANREVARVLKPGGLAYIEIHLFPSISGGHDLPWIVPGHVDLGDRPPWGHLRDPAWTAPVPLNRFREHEFRKAFEATPGLRIVEWEVEYREGDHFLSDPARKELAEYSDRELTTRSVIAVLRKEP